MLSELGSIALLPATSVTGPASEVLCRSKLPDQARFGFKFKGGGTFTTITNYKS